MRLLIEWFPERGIWAIFPTIVVFKLGSDPVSPDSTVITLAWLCGGVSVVYP